jgi:plasmid stabilization system protein ParE
MSVALTRSPDSIRDVAGILQFFIDKNTPATALKFGKRVEKTLELLALFPEMGSPWESKKTGMRGVRFQSVQGFRNCLIFYRMTEPGLYVKRIVDGRRDLEQIL